MAITLPIQGQAPRAGSAAAGWPEGHCQLDGRPSAISVATMSLLALTKIGLALRIGTMTFAAVEPGRNSSALAIAAVA